MLYLEWGAVVHQAAGGRRCGETRQGRRSAPGAKARSWRSEDRWAGPLEGAAGGVGRVEERNTMGFTLAPGPLGGVFREVTLAASVEGGQGREGVRLIGRLGA